MPLSDKFRVRGIGVAVKVRISTSRRMLLSFSFWRTPKRCSSSTIKSPKSLYLISLFSSLWVPIKISVFPLVTPRKLAFCSVVVLNLEITSTSIGQSEKRSLKVSKCCWASNVVGTNMATCL